MNHFLKRNNKYDTAIIEKKKNNTKYCFYKILNILTEEMHDEPEETIIETAIDCFWEAIYPGAEKQNISFNFEIKSYYIIKVIFPDKTESYISSDVYPGKIIYSSRESASKAIQRVQDFYPKNTIFKIEKKINE